jgi:enoyl-CoA hydratase/carnithine racemase
LTTDIPVALANTLFRLPGVTIGLPCTSPSTIFSRRLNPALAYRMLATGEPIRADQTNGIVDVVPVPEQATDVVEHDPDAALLAQFALEKRVAGIVTQLAEQTAAQPTALGKWAFWTQVGMAGQQSGGDGYEDAVEWTGRVMALHAKANDAKEGIGAFFEKRMPNWIT